MKIKSRLRLLCAVLAVFALLGSTAFAATGNDEVLEPQASYYLTGYGASCITYDGGIIDVEIGVIATDTMPKVGASYVKVQCYLNNQWTTVASASGTVANGLLGSNCHSHNATFTYINATEGNSYRAVVTVYAGDSSGSDSRIYTTAAVIAK